MLYEISCHIGLVSYRDLVLQQIFVKTRPHVYIFFSCWSLIFTDIWYIVIQKMIYQNIETLLTSLMICSMDSFLLAEKLWIAICCLLICYLFPLHSERMEFFFSPCKCLMLFLTNNGIFLHVMVCYLGIIILSHRSHRTKKHDISRLNGNSKLR